MDKQPWRTNCSTRILPSLSNAVLNVKGKATVVTYFTPMLPAKASSNVVHNMIIIYVAFLLSVAERRKQIRRALRTRTDEESMLGYFQLVDKETAT